MKKLTLIALLIHKEAKLSDKDKALLTKWTTEEAFDLE